MSSVLPLVRVSGSRRTIAPGHRRVAAIDIGSNSIRQIVADVSPEGAIQVVDEMKAAPRLAAGLSKTGELADTSIRAALDAIERMATLAKQLGASRIDAVATSAVREASNAASLLSEITRITGLKVRVLDGDEEARLSFRSAVAHFDMGVGRTVVIDIGGGSLEIALSAEGVIERLGSLPFGAIRLTEEYFSDGVTPKAVRKLRRMVAERVREQIPIRDWRGAQLIGSGGTFTNLAGIYLARQGILTARSVHAAHIPRADLEHILDMLSGMTAEERRQVPGLNPERADIIVAGIAVAAEVLRRIESREIVVSRYGIREGLLLEAARVAPTIADPGEARARSVTEFAARCHVEQPHSSHVQHLALVLFDALGERLGLSKSDREVLSDAALLHDSGYHISYERHHKHSYHLVLHADLLGMSPSDQVLVANVARYHRGQEPKRRHRNFGMLEKSLRRRIRRLSALLRVADGFDRGHVSAVADLKVRWTRRALRITPVAANARASMRLEMWGANRKSGLLAKLAGVPVEIVGPDGRVMSSESIETSDSD
ncbi:MAG TPA: Ppx/GppA phosphatase family protein [Gemmatimonadaceae bacterium]|jgi:exopolyphosphatase/guanosine-5'-triphosphate,3'-diphosphate pyrophosphatase